jgi:hypothetical protein
MKEIGMITKHGTSGEKENRSITMSQPLVAPPPVIRIPVKGYPQGGNPLNVDQLPLADLD